MPTNKQRREAARRHLERQLERREQDTVRRKRRNLITTVVGVVVIVAVVAVVLIVSTSSGGKSAPAAAGGACGYTQSGTAAKNVGVPPDPKTTPTTNRALSITSNLGDIKIQLDGAAAPCNVQSIAYLAGKGYFDGSKCHRLVTSGIFVLQCGDPTGTGSGGPGYTTKDENLSSADYSKVGTVVMANAGANTNGSQFFIIYKDTSTLPKNYTVIGSVTAGMDIVQKVAAAGSDNSNGAGDGAPKLPITLTKVTVSPTVQGSGTALPSALPSATAPAATPTGAGTSPANTAVPSGAAPASTPASTPAATGTG